MVLSYADRQQHWEWCREYIDRECIYRVDAEHPPIPSKKPGGTYVWQFYLRRATYNPQFARRLGLLFWDHFLPVYRQQPFQVCACDPSGPPIGAAIQAQATRLDVPLNLFIVRREPKGIGTDNFFDGRVLPELPVLIVDDIAASSPFMLNASARIQVKLGLQLHRNYFTVVNKVGHGFSKEAQHTDSYLDNELVALFSMNNFAKSAGEFKTRYGQSPKWTGVVK